MKKLLSVPGFPQSRQGVCHAVILLNKFGKMAHADDAIVGRAWCGCKEQIWSPEDNSYICASCWTPARESNDGQA